MLMQLMGVDNVVILVIESMRFELLKVFVHLPDGFRWFGVSIHGTSHDGVVPFIEVATLLPTHLLLIVRVFSDPAADVDVVESKVNI
jgi:hypothetical protein